MGSSIDEALRAKAIAEKKFLERDFVGAKDFALKAQMLCPELEGINQMVASFKVYIASEVKINGELDFYSILGADPSAEKSKLKKQYKKLAVLLHPDKNRTIGADGAFKLVSEAWLLLSDSVKRNSYDQRRNLYYDNCSKFPLRVDTFWTVCTSCHVQYEYLRKYVNKRLSCKNCRGVFIAVETGLAPMSGSFPYSNYNYAPENGFGSHGCGVPYVPKTSGYHGANGHHTGYKSEHVSTISFQGNSSVNSIGVLDPNGLSSSSFVFYQASGESNITKANGEKNPSHNGYTSHKDASKPKRGRPSKKMKMDFGGSFINGHEEKTTLNISAETKIANVNGTLKPSSRLSFLPDNSIKRSSAIPVVDARQLLIDRAKLEIQTKLGEMKLASEAAAEAKKRNTNTNTLPEAKVAELKRSASMAITVPDSDFHDFDKDRSEECFKPKQVWALYDEEDGMPRLYCLIREVISVNPFKIYIGYLNSKSDTEFGSVNWLDSGFTKSCGSFRVFHSETVEQVNIFSHLLSKEKAGRGGCLRIYPRCGDIWAVYRNWSPDWNRTTPDEVRHQYEMVEVLADYSEEKGVWVTPLVKLNGYKTVYQRNGNSDAVRWIPRREMLRFSHQVPSCYLTVEGTDLPEGCWDLDPAATPEELLQENVSSAFTKTEIYPVEEERSTVEILQEEEYMMEDEAAAAAQLPQTKTIAKVLEELS